MARIDAEIAERRDQLRVVGNGGGEPLFALMRSIAGGQVEPAQFAVRRRQLGIEAGRRSERLRARPVGSCAASSASARLYSVRALLGSISSIWR